jgi:hypothetical protein
MPPSTMTIPEKIKSGMASRIYLVIESKVIWVRRLQGSLRALITTRLPERLKTKKIGTEMARVMTPKATDRYITMQPP